ncbi:MAG: hypothetical protein IKU52_08610 [Clostridia bacterium]|nr:hypothetical protein [Clostridia bacterium]
MNTAIQASEETPTKELFESELDAYLQYKMICTRDPFRDNDPGEDKVYSIVILKLKEYCIAESFFMYDISRNLEKALGILNCLQRNAVTPCIAENVLQDLI